MGWNRPRNIRGILRTRVLGKSKHFLYFHSKSRTFLTEHAHRHTSLWFCRWICFASAVFSPFFVNVILLALERLLTLLFKVFYTSNALQEVFCNWCLLSNPVNYANCVKVPPFLCSYWSFIMPFFINALCQQFTSDANHSNAIYDFSMSWS